MSVAAVEPDALPFPGARQGFAARLAALARGQWSVENPNHWRRDALWGEDRCRLRNKNAACALALLRTALLRPVLRCGWGARPARSSSASRPAPVMASICSPDAPSRDRT